MSKEKLKTIFCVRVRRFKNGSINVVSYPVKAEFLPEIEVTRWQEFDETKKYFITSQEAEFVMTQITQVVDMLLRA